MEFDEILTLMDRFSSSACTALKLSWRGDTLELQRVTSPPMPERPIFPRSHDIAPLTADGTSAPISSVGAPATSTPGPSPDGDAASLITAPILGTFHCAPAPDADPFVKVGQTVRKDQTLCIIEAMKMMNEVTAERDYVIEEVLVDDGAPCEYATALFRVRELPSC